MWRYRHHLDVRRPAAFWKWCFKSCRRNMSSAGVKERQQEQLWSLRWKRWIKLMCNTFYDAPGFLELAQAPGILAASFRQCSGGGLIWTLIIPDVVLMCFVKSFSWDSRPCLTLVKQRKCWRHSEMPSRFPSVCTFSASCSRPRAQTQEYKSARLIPAVSWVCLKPPWSHL